MKSVFVSIAVVVAVLSSAGVAQARPHGHDNPDVPGPSPQLDSICYSNPAFRSDPPVAVLNGVPLQAPKVGLRAQNDYCRTDAVAPPDYGDNA